jgi:AcrR family transcriptional regulator
MPTARWKDLDPKRRRALLAAAEDEFLAHDYEQASLNRLLTAAGVSKGAFYYHFSDKLDLFLTMLEALQARLQASIGGFDKLASGEGDFWDVLTAMTRRSLTMLKAEPRLVRLNRSFWQLVHTRGDEPRMQGFVEQIRGQQLQMIGWGQAQGAVRNDLPEALFQNVMWAIGEATDRWFAGAAEDVLTDERAIDEVARMLVGIYRCVGSARPPASRAAS